MEHQVDNNIEELEMKNRYKDEIIKSCLEFIDKLLPAYMNEKNHIIMGNDWELNRSIYVMSELRDRLLGYNKGMEMDRETNESLNNLHRLQQNCISLFNNWDDLKRWLEKNIEELDVVLGANNEWYALSSYRKVLKKMEDLENGNG